MVVGWAQQWRPGQRKLVRISCLNDRRMPPLDSMALFFTWQYEEA
jgi:hypothetical protein